MKLKQTLLKPILLIIFSTVFLSMSYATHIVGGELTYRCLGHNDQYEITLTIYRDCIHAKAEFDDPACVGIYSYSSGILYKTLKMPYKIEMGNPDTLKSIPCIFTDEPVCVERYTYKDTVSLPLNNAGYLISYQRCCRNESLKNIVDPLKTGTTFYVIITNDVLKDCNSSPVFKSLPNNFVCINEPLHIDHSATDEEGDLLVYKLCTPVTGGLYGTVPKPCPPLFLPYAPVIWAPPYNENNMLGNANALKIDAVTGEITGIPDSIGQYLVGICVEEYRNGILYSTIRRDFEYNVVPCISILSDWEVNTECGSLTASFNNMSTMADQFNWTYLDINKGNGLPTVFNSSGDTSDFNFSFPDTGSYKVCLESSLMGSTCKMDTLCKLVRIDPPLKIDQLHDDTLNICTSKSIFLNPDTLAGYKYKWINASGLVPSDSAANPLAFPKKTTSYTMAYWDPLNTCPPDTQQMTVFVKREIDSLGFKMRIKNCCDTIRIEVYDIDIDFLAGTGPLEWEWLLETPYGNQVFNDSIPLFNPFIKTAGGNELIKLSVKALTTDSCIFIGSKIDIIKPYKLDNGPFVHHHKICLGDTIDLYPGADPGLVYEWQPGAGLIPNNTTANPSASPTEKTLYTVSYTDPDCLCSVKDSVLIEVLDTVHLSFDFKLLCDDKTVVFNNTSDTGINSFMWMFGDPDNSTSAELNPTFTYKNFGTYKVSLITKDSTVCADTFMVVIMLMDSTADFNCEQECSNPLKFSFKDLTNHKYNKVIHWEWKSDGVKFDTIQDPMYMFPDTGMYMVTLIVTYDNLCMDIVTRKYNIHALDLKIPDTVISCLGHPVELNPDGNPSYTYNWTPCNASLDDCNSYNPTASPPFSTAYYVTVSYVLACGNTCQYFDTVYVVEFNPKLAPDTIDCENHKILHVLNVAQNDTIKWKDINGNILGNGNDYGIDVFDSTKFILCVSSIYGCTLMDTFTIAKPYGIPPLEITAEPDSFCIETNTIQLVATFDPGYIYKWTPPESLSADDIYNPIATPSETTTYYLRVTDENGCTSIDSITVFDICLCNVYLPNAFSPNDDQINDVLYVRGENFRSMELIIYNRWGQLVFRTTDQNIGWDGTHEGEKYDPDVFAFYLNVICLNGEKYTKKGNINLLR